jgi:hypothetical protein
MVRAVAKSIFASMARHRGPELGTSDATERTERSASRRKRP